MMKLCLSENSLKPEEKYENDSIISQATPQAARADLGMVFQFLLIPLLTATLSFMIESYRAMGFGGSKI
jgi:hypothetical protein